jgi:hypothetical protein
VAAKAIARASILNSRRRVSALQSERLEFADSSIVMPMVLHS